MFNFDFFPVAFLAISIIVFVADFISRIFYEGEDLEEKLKKKKDTHFISDDGSCELFDDSLEDKLLGANSWNYVFWDDWENHWGGW